MMNKVTKCQRPLICHKLYVRYVEGKKRVAPIDMGEREFSPPYVLRIFRQFGFTDGEIEELLK